MKNLKVFILGILATMFFIACNNTSTPPQPQKYSIEYELNGGAWVADYDAPSEYTEGEEVNLPYVQKLTRAGSTFAGWYETETFTGTAITTIAKDTQGNKKFYAKWNTVNYSIMLDTAGCLNVLGGSWRLDKDYASAGETVTLTVTADTENNYFLESCSVSVKKMGNRENVEVTQNENNFIFTMPADDVRVYLNARWERFYSITISDQIIGGFVTADKTSAKSGETVSLTVIADAANHYIIPENPANIVTVTAGEETISVTYSKGKYSFIMPEENVTISATFILDSYRITSYVTGRVGGTVLVNDNGYVGETITIVVEPEDDYGLSKIEIKDLTNRTLLMATSTQSENKWTFIMPAGEVEVNATFSSLFTVTVRSGTANPTRAIEGKKVTIQAYQAPQGKEFYKWQTTTSGVSFSNQKEATTSFIMPARDVEITADYVALPAQRINLPDPPVGCIIKANKQYAYYYDSVTVTVEADTKNNYVLTYCLVSVSKKSGGTVAVTQNGNDYTFKMPEEEVTVSVDAQCVLSQ